MRYGQDVVGTRLSPAVFSRQCHNKLTRVLRKVKEGDVSALCAILDEIHNYGDDVMGA